MNKATHRLAKNPLHGVTLKALLEDVVKKHGWPELAKCVEIRCFMFDPSINSSLKFLRKNEWARTAVERIYLTGDTRPGRERAAIARKHGKPKRPKKA